MLSLFMPETPTQPQPPVKTRATRRLPAIDEIDTRPPQAASAQNLVRVDNALPAPAYVERGLVRAPQTRPLPESQPTEQHSWTAGPASGSPSAQLIVSPARNKHWQKLSALNPIDRTRWWLLRPGRLEFILWLGGTFLLIGITCLLLLVSALSFQWFGAPASPVALHGNANNQATRQPARSPAVTSPAITRVDSGTLVAGGSFELRGQGFKPSSQITFYFDNVLPLFNQQSLPASTRTDKQGNFSCTLWFGTGPMWTAGKHTILIRDVSAGQSMTMNIMLSAASNSAIARSTPVTNPTPGVTHTPTPTPPVSQGTPVGRPPVTMTPTPTPTKTTPTPTPTVGTTPTVTPTAGITPTPAVSPSAATSGLGNALNDSGAPPFTSRLVSVSPLVWVMVACYLLAMLSLGAAGIIHRRRR